MLLIALLYLLLAMPVRVQAFVCMHGLRGNALLEVCVPGVVLCRNVPIPDRKAGKKRGRRARLSGMIRACRMEQLSAYIRVGTGEAAQTALAAGALRAAVLGALASMRLERQADVRVEPVYDSPCFSLAAGGILSCAAGDIIFAALTAALKKSGKRDSVGKASH